jgi:SAM-dependent methyltransferase
MERKKISLNDLPAWSQWPKELLGLSQRQTTSRTTEKVEQEYNKEKYFSCIEKYKKVEGKITMDEMKQSEVGTDTTANCVSFGDDLFIMELGEARKAYYSIIKEALAPHIEKSDSILELGCGYGYNLWMLQQEFSTPKLHWFGGEYSTNAVELGRQFARRTENTEIDQFNFYETPYDILQKTNGLMTVFTSHAIEQIPSAVSFIEGLRLHKDRINRVINIEPVYESDETLLGLMRRRYTEICDYNTDLLTLLENAPDIHIVSIKKNVMGINPLNSSSVIEWEFVS